MTDIFEYPLEWYRFTSVRFRLRSASQVSDRPWAGGRSVYGPHVQLWTPQLVATEREQVDWRPIDAFFARLGGQAGLMRISDASRPRPLYNVLATAATEPWSDGTVFSDGTGFVSGLLPPTAYVYSAAARGATSLVIGGLPASLAPALKRGDLLEIRPNGIPAGYPHLYEVMVDGPTDSSGRTGVEIRPGLRADIAASDQVVLEYPTSVFHLIDDSQGEIEVTVPVIGNFGFALIEAIELVP